MPLALDPKRTVDFSLKLDRELPEKDRPVFTTRFITYGERLRIRELRRLAIKAETDEEAMRLYYEALGIGLVGWRNLKDRKGEEIPSATLDRLAEILTFGEMWELLEDLVQATSLGELELKKPESRSQSDTDESAGDAGPESA